MQTTNSSERVNFESILTSEVDYLDQDYLIELAALLRAHKLKIAVIESMTGGGIARKLVEMPGCSDYFLGGVIAYSPFLKTHYGMVKPQTISKHGIVSASVVEEMVSGVKKQTKADVVIASNGFASLENKINSVEAKGSVFLSWNICDRIKKTKRFKIEGARNEVIDKSVFIALSMCLRYLKNEFRKD